LFFFIYQYPLFQPANGWHHRRKRALAGKTKKAKMPLALIPQKRRVTPLLSGACGVRPAGLDGTCPQPGKCPGAEALKTAGQARHTNNAITIKAQLRAKWAGVKSQLAKRTAPTLPIKNGPNQIASQTPKTNRCLRRLPAGKTPPAQKTARNARAPAGKVSQLKMEIAGQTPWRAKHPRTRNGGAILARQPCQKTQKPTYRFAGRALSRGKKS